MKFKAFKIEKLFNQYDYLLDFTKNENIAIITGPNGYGKSTILRIMYYLFSSNLYPFFDILFSSCEYTFQNDNGTTTSLIIEKVLQVENGEGQSDLLSDEHTVLRISLNSESQKIHIEISKTAIESAIVSAGYSSDKNGNWWKKDSGEYVTSHEILIQHPEIIEKQFIDANDLLMFIGGLNAMFISDQRLFYTTFEIGHGFKNTMHFNKAQVLYDADWMRKNISNLKKKFSESFNAALLEAFTSSPQKTILSSNLKERLEKLNKNISTLINYGIAEQNHRIVTSINKQSESLLAGILSSCEEVVEKALIEINSHIKFVSLINKSGFPDKIMSIDSSNGFSFLSSKGTYISPEMLSSGEQHRIILIFKLLFRIKPGMLVLIDEPELSFHVIWQTSFISELKQILGNKNILTIIATHSPQIIDGKWSLTTDLYELTKKTRS